jgi:hypothetical protein
MFIELSKSQIMLKTLHENDSHEENRTNEDNITCASMYRHMKKVKDILPQTPKNKAVILKKLIESPSTSKVLSGQGLTLTPACKKKLQVADDMVESVKEGISEVKSSGRKDIEKIQKKRVYQEHALRASWQQKQIRYLKSQVANEVS